jgi:hypothetical protein
LVVSLTGARIDDFSDIGRLDLRELVVAALGARGWGRAGGAGLDAADGGEAEAPSPYPQLLGHEAPPIVTVPAVHVTGSGGVHGVMSMIHVGCTVGTYGVG